MAHGVRARGGGARSVAAHSRSAQLQRHAWTIWGEEGPSRKSSAGCGLHGLHTLWGRLGGGGPQALTVVGKIEAGSAPVRREG